MPTAFIESPTEQRDNFEYAFIKQHLRYPLNSFKRIFPFVFFTLVLGLLTALIWMGSSLQVQRSLLSFIFIQGFSVGAMCLGMYRYWRSLFFVRLPAEIDESANIRLLREFMQMHRFKVYQVPGHPEAFMISSRENRENKESEIVVFIAVDKAILVNSHISTAAIFPKSNRRYRDILDLLRDFLAQSSNAVLPVRTAKAI